MVKHCSHSMHIHADGSRTLNGGTGGTPGQPFPPGCAQVQHPGLHKSQQHRELRPGVSIFRQDLALAKQAHGGGGSNGKWQGDPAPLKLHLFQYT